MEATSPDASDLPRPFGPFTLTSQLGIGGAGTVYRAERQDGSVVAVKVLKHASLDDAEQVRRFTREARAAATVSDVRVVHILETGEVDGTPYLVMPHLAGGTVSDELERGPLQLERVARIAVQVAEALDGCHRAGLMHRDVKASNVLLDEAGDAWLADFGLARAEGFSQLTRPGQMMGTLEYVAPEVIRGAETSPAVDVYAYGCLVFELLTGRTPFAGRGALAVGMAHLDEPPGDPCAGREDLPSGSQMGVAAAVYRALAKRPEDRAATAGEVARALSAALGPR